MSEDPIGIAGGINVYAYAANSPTVFVDPTGLDINDWLLGGGLGPIGVRAGQLDRARPDGFVLPGSQAEDARNASHYAFLNAAEQSNDPLSAAVKFEIGVGAIILYDLIKVPGTLAYYLVGVPMDSLSNTIGTPGYSSNFEKIDNPVTRLFGFDSPLTFSNIWSQFLGLSGGLLSSYNNPWEVKGVASTDPNDIVGPVGYGPQNFLPASTPYAYTIDFANLATATAPAQQIVITEQLDPSLDWRSLRLTGFSFDNMTTTLSGNQAF
jgi:hypothetical protein